MVGRCNCGEVDGGMVDQTDWWKSRMTDSWMIVDVEEKELCQGD